MRRNDSSFMRSFLEKQQKASGMDDREGAVCIGMIGDAGASTMGCPLHTFVLAMLHHPQWLARVQEEIKKYALGTLSIVMTDGHRLGSGNR